MNANDEWKDCKHLFSNGMEFEIFLEDQCAKCKRYRNDHYCGADMRGDAE